MHIWDELPQPLFILAPMDDVTDSVFRRIIASTAAPDLFFTEFVNVDGLQSPGREKLLPKLQFTKTERPIIAQIWGKHPENYYKTTKDLIKMGFDGVDINMGCPVKAVVKNGCCAALIDDKKRAGEIIAAVREAAGPDFPVSVKTRLGNKKLDMSWPEYLLGQKLNVLTIHARLAKDMSKYPADWAKIGEIREMRDRLSPSTKIIGNGDVESREQGQELAEKYKLDGIMIGRGVFHDPYVFAKTSPWSEMSPTEKLKLYRKHIELFAETWQKRERNIYTLNKFCKTYVNDFPGAKELREQLINAGSTQALLEILDSRIKD